VPMRIFFTPIEGVEAVGKYQARFHLSRSCGPLLAMLAQATEVVNEKALQEKDPKLFPIGTGPYRFAEWVKDDHITLERWEKYHRPGRPYLDKIIFYAPRSEEHTSELQSLTNLVCRLLLEKKKQDKQTTLPKATQHS